MRELFGDEEPDVLEMSEEESEAIDRQIFPEDRRFCALHSFVFPIGGGEIICADFEWAGSGSALEPHLRMESGLLYHHSYAGHTPATAIGSFEALDRRVWQLSLMEEELGWVILVPLDKAEEPGVALPSVGSHPVVQVGQDTLEFEVVRQIRRRWRRTSYETGNPVKTFDLQDVQMWCCPANPQAIGDWIRGYMDFAAYVEFWKSKDMEEMIEIGLRQWLFETETGFRLQFDPFQTSQYALKTQP